MGWVPPLPRSHWCPSTSTGGDAPFAGTVVPVTTARYHRISHSGDLRLRGLIRGSLAFTRPFFPLPGFSVWLRDSLGFTPCFTPCRCQQRMPESGIGFGHLPKPFGYSTEAASCRTPRPPHFTPTTPRCQDFSLLPRSPTSRPDGRWRVEGQ